MRSFKLKLTLLTMALSGLVLALFALGFLKVFERLSIERMDREIRAIAETQLRSPHPRAFWSQFDTTLAFLFGEDFEKTIVIEAIDSENSLLYRSEAWPERLSASLELPLPPGQLDDTTFSPPGRPPDAPPRPRRMREDGLRRPPGPPPERPPDRGPEHRTPMSKLIEPTFKTVPLSDSSWRVGVLGNDYVTLAAAMNMSSVHDEYQHLQRMVLAAALPGLLLLGAIGWFLAGRAIRPVNRVAETARSITASDLSKRIPGTASDHEFEQLITVFNQMLERLETSFQQAVRFSGDAAHELKTPLTILRGNLEAALQEAPAGSELQQSLGSLLEEVQRLSHIVRKLLLLSQADSGQMSMTTASVKLDQLLADAITDMEDLFPDIATTRSIQQATVLGDATLLSQAVQNLLQNAARYNLPENGKISIELEQEDRVVRLRILNTGPALVGKERELVFERFFRMDKAHNRNVDGTGLGLSLSREIVRRHGGKLFVGDAPDGWTCFVLELPAA